MNIEDNGVITVTYDKDIVRFPKEGILKPTSEVMVEVMEFRNEHQIPIKIKMLEFEVKETETEYIINMKYIEKNVKYELNKNQTAN